VTGRLSIPCVEQGELQHSLFRSCRIAGPRSAVIQSRPVGRSACSIRALVSAVADQDHVAQPEALLQLGDLGRDGAGSAVLPSDTSTATRQPSDAHSRPISRGGRHRRRGFSRGEPADSSVPRGRST
jgi:hypothetical protein